MSRLAYFDSFVRSREPDLRRRDAKKCREAGIDVGDVVQETWVRLLAKYPDVTDPDELFALALTISTNVFNDMVGVAHRRREEGSDDLEVVAGASHVSVEGQVIARRDTSDVLGEIAAMPPAQGLVLALTGLGWRPGEIARHLRVSPAAVYSSCQRGRERLRKGAVGAGRATVAVLSFRRLRAAAATAPTSLAFVSLAALTVAVPLVLTPLPTRPAYADPGELVARRGAPRPVVARTLAGTPGAVRVANAASPLGYGSGPHGRLAGDSPSALPKTHLCVGSVCHGDPNTPGAELYLKQPIPVVGGSVSETQDYVNACPVTPDNDAVGCRNHGHPDYLVDPTPGPTPP
jgi:DNA-directed RNA polymerase specialized sigma24 family protein